MKRARHITATELAECCVCEQRVLFDRTRGKRRSAQRRQQMLAGEAAHSALHQEALRESLAQARDPRCFVASALWGPVDPRTEALRAWRDRWLLRRWWGPPTVGLYYALSPWLVRVMCRTPRLRKSIEAGLSGFVRLLEARGE
jgi:hypothetical protein